MQTMAVRRPSRRAIAAYIREQIEGKIGKPDRRGVPYTQKSLADAMGLTKGQIWHILHPERTGTSGVGQETIDGFLQVFEMETADLEAAAHEWERQHPDSFDVFVHKTKEGHQVVKDERYANRSLAAEFARRSGVLEEAIQAIEQQALLGPDLSPEDWLSRMKAKASELKTSALPHPKVSRGVPIEEDDLGPPPEPIRPPKKGK